MPPVNLTFLEMFLDLNPVLILLIIAAPLALLVWIGFKLSDKLGPDIDAAELAKQALALVSGGFIFIGAFAIVTSWDNQSRLGQTVINEFSSMTALAEDFGALHVPAGKTIAHALMTYAQFVKDTEIGTLGMVSPNREAQHQIAQIEYDVDQFVNSATLNPHQAEMIYAHLETIKAARKDRLTVTLPNLPVTVVVLVALSACLTLFGIAIFPPPRVRWIKFYYLGASLTVVVALVFTVFVLQAPKNAAEQVSKPIDIFIFSVKQGGANLKIGSPGEGGGQPPKGDGTSPQGPGTPPPGGESPPAMLPKPRQ
jgi:hypothetical protein